MKETVTLRKTARKPRRPQVKGMCILMIDDHPSQLEGYQSILESVAPKQLEVVRSHSFKEAFIAISTGMVSPDVVFLDMHMPPFPEENIFSGEDMAGYIKSAVPDSHLIVITAFSEIFLLYNLTKNVDPDGVMVKSDFHAWELREAFRMVLSGEKYYTTTVRNGIKELLTREKFLDSLNRQIIILLSQGIRTKDLPKHLNMSLSAIEKRKAQLKDYFCLDGGTDEHIVNEARKLGFI